MKTKFFNACLSNLPAAIAIVSFVLFSSIKQTDDGSKITAANECCKGYSVNQEDLRKFMLDSLSKSQFEGGLYKKTELSRKFSGQVISISRKPTLLRQYKANNEHRQK